MSLQAPDITLHAVVLRTKLDVLMLTEYGSRTHGTATPASDHDLMGIYVEHDHEIYGLSKAETKVYRVHSDGRLETMGVSSKESRSGADVTEMHFHPLRKYVSLAAAGNPTVLSAMWALGSFGVTHTEASALLVEHRDLFLSKHAGFRHAGYARAQRDALLGRTNQRTRRPELESRYGYDTKYAAHLIRLLLTGLDLVRDRTYHLPMKAEHVELVGEIRRGEHALDDVLCLSEKLEHELTVETEDSSLADSVDYDAVNDLLRRVRNAHLAR